MAAPSATARVTPPGFHMKDGFRFLIAFAADPDILLWEKSASPPGFDGGDLIDTTTQHNGTWRIMRTRSLITMTEMSGRCAYHPLVYPQIQALINVETTVTFHWPTGNYTAFYGALRVFEPDEMSEGEHPEASYTVSPINFDPTNRVEAGPLTGTT